MFVKLKTDYIGGCARSFGNVTVLLLCGMTLI